MDENMSGNTGYDKHWDSKIKMKIYKPWTSWWLRIGFLRKLYLWVLNRRIKNIEVVHHRAVHPEVIEDLRHAMQGLRTQPYGTFPSYVRPLCPQCETPLAGEQIRDENGTLRTQCLLLACQVMWELDDTGTAVTKRVEPM